MLTIHTAIIKLSYHYNYCIAIHTKLWASYVAILCKFQECQRSCMFAVLCSRITFPSNSCRFCECLANMCGCMHFTWLRVRFFKQHLIKKSMFDVLKLLPSISQSTAVSVQSKFKHLFCFNSNKMATTSKNASAAVHDKVKSCHHHLQVFNIYSYSLIDTSKILPMKFWRWKYYGCMTSWQWKLQNLHSWNISMCVPIQWDVVLWRCSLVVLICMGMRNR